MTDKEPRADEQPPKFERGGLWGLFLGAAALLFLPYGVVLSVFGVVQGFRARRAARENSTYAPVAVASVVVGVAGILITAAAGAMFVVYDEEITAYRDCSVRAHTVSTQKACDEAWESGTGLPPALPSLVA
ncbi:DUF4190 domain-containing protein [Nocardiopsis sp. LOL_012]|uniref:DUF4190 domain-containing protein n=1 Tax=Nocardiopsis sp. LOL_012 TaxID=3345409 RepID=UPI003A895224